MIIPARTNFFQLIRCIEAFKHTSSQNPVWQEAGEKTRRMVEELEARMEAERVALREEAATMARSAASAAEDRSFALASSRFVLSASARPPLESSCLG